MISIGRYFQKAYRLGFVTTNQVIKHRVTSWAKQKKLRLLAKYSHAYHVWPNIRKLYTSNCNIVSCTVNKFTPQFFNDFQDGNIGYKQKAQQALSQGISFLGSLPVALENLDWQEDIRLACRKKRFRTFKKHFYKDIFIEPTLSTHLGKDIKIPWEISRFNYLHTFGQAYLQSHDPVLAQVFVALIERWIDENPYLYGVNWVCPMDVALRALNWIAAISFFQKAPNITEEFWQKIICSLYDHMYYLERNWEIYDTQTSNHYLSDLVGYLYLTHFFSEAYGIKAKRAWVIQELYKEFRKQIFIEGTSYEGSTRYHGLVTELFYLAYILIKEINPYMAIQFEEKLSAMFAAAQWFTPFSANEMVQIGDNDSGKALTGLGSFLKQKNLPEKMGVKHYNEFGLSIIKTERVHITLRHHAYHPNQPSGHFHNDWASITIAIDGVPVIVDPGTYVYTASSIWRNYFRSIFNHNSSFIMDVEPIAITNNLFFLDVPANSMQSRETTYLIQTSHTLYQQFGLQFNRSVKLDQVEQSITIVDWWQQINQKKLASVWLGWNFSFHSDITLVQDGQYWQIGVKDQKLFKVDVHSTLNMQKKDLYYSAAYGKLQKSSSLKGYSDKNPTTVVTTLSYS